MVDEANEVVGSNLPASSPMRARRKAPASPSPPLSKEAKAFGEKAHDLDALRAAVVDAAGVGAGLWFSYIFVLLYLLVAVGTVTHKDLLFESPVRLPFLNVELPLTGFFVFGPFLFLIVHSYVILHLALLADKVNAFHGELERQLASRAEIWADLRRQLPINIFVQFLAGPPKVREGVIGSMLWLVVQISLVAGPILLLGMFLIQFLPYHHPWATICHRVVLLCDLILLWLLWFPVARRASTRPRTFACAAGLVSVAVLSLACFVATFPGETLYATRTWIPCWWRHEDGTWRRASLHEVLIEGDLVDASRARRWGANRLVLPGFDVIDRAKLDTAAKIAAVPVTISLRGRDLRGAVLIDARLGKADLTEANLQDARLDGVQLEGAKLVKAQLQRTELVGAHLEGAKLDGAQLQEARLDRAHLQDAILDNARLVDASFYEARLQAASFVWAELRRARLEGAQLQRARLDQADLQEANFIGAQLHEANLLRTKLPRARFDGANLWNAKLDDAQLREARFDDAQLQGASFLRAELQKARFVRANLHGARLDEAQLQNACLDWAQMEAANLNRASLQEASLVGAHLRGASFDGARLDGAKLEEALLQGARLEDAQLLGANLVRAKLQGVNLDGAQLQGAILDQAILHGASLDRTAFLGASLEGVEFQGATFRDARLQGARLSRAQFHGARLERVFGWRANIGRARVGSTLVIEPKTDKLSIGDFEQLKARIYGQMADGDRRALALNAIRDRLDPRAKMSPEPEDEMEQDWMQLDNTRPDPAEFEGDVIEQWRLAGCAEAGSPYVLRALLVNFYRKSFFDDRSIKIKNQITTRDAQVVSWVDRLSALAETFLKDDCPGARRLTEDERTFLKTRSWTRTADEAVRMR